MISRPRRLLTHALLVAVAVGLAGCTAGAAPGAADAETPRPGGTLRFAVSSDQGCLDPQQVVSTESVYSVRHLVDSLLDQDPSTGELRPWLATDWEVTPDATRYTFTLREGVTFSDGTPLDAAVVKANFDRIPELGLRAQLPQAYLAGYNSTTVDSPTRFTVTFDQPNVQFLQGTSTHSLGILSTGTVARSDDDRCAGVVGSGPFTVDRYEANASFTLARRTGYAWPSSLAAHQGEARLDALEFRVVPESGIRTGALISGEVEVISTIGEQDEFPLTGAGIRLLSRPNPGLVLGLGFNLSAPVVSDPAVRQALSLTIDRNEITGTVFPSQTAPATSVLSSTTPSFADQSAHLRSGTAEAAALLDEAGWFPGPDGVRTKDGLRLTVPVSFVSNFSTNKPALELMQQQVRAAGIDLQLAEVPITQVAAQMESGDFVANWANLTRADPDLLRSTFSIAGANTYRFPDGELEPLLIAQAGETDPAARTALVGQAQEIIARDMLYLPVVQPTTVLAAAPDVHDIAFDASSRLQLHGAWISR